MTVGAAAPSLDDAPPLVARLVEEARSRDGVPGFVDLRFAAAERFERGARVVIATNRVEPWHAFDGDLEAAALRPYTVWQRMLIVGVERAATPGIDWSLFRRAGWGPGDG